MKKLLYIITFFSVVLNAQSYLISNIPLPKTYIQNLDPYPCDEECLQNFLDNDMILSFLSHADKQLNNAKQDEVRMMSISILNLGSQVSNKLKIALLLPYKKIGRYAASTTNASFAYLLARNQDFELKTYNIETEKYEDIEKALYEIQENGFEYIIAPFTQEGASTLISLKPYENIYFPTINKKDLNTTLPNIYFGGIDYRAQSDLLLKEAVSPLVIFYDKSPTGKKLAEYEEKMFKLEDINSSDANNSLVLKNEAYGLLEFNTDENASLEDNRTVVKFSIPRRTTNLEKQLFENEEIKRGSFFINTPIVKSSMIISQLTMYDTNSTNVLSTQINYDPLILSLTQFEDRESMIIANSITHNNSIFIETNSLLGNDIVYDWINYTTTVGMDYFFNKITKQDRQYKIDVINNQMQYPIELLQPSKTRFIKYFSAIE
ncbi:MAG: hypothetical protein OQK11_02085 [Thiovulaceae bacterium]|nr:hypothetical protein [Sulfurimonadaceae bacterium]